MAEAYGRFGLEELERWLAGRPRRRLDEALYEDLEDGALVAIRERIR